MHASVCTHTRTHTGATGRQCECEGPLWPSARPNASSSHPPHLRHPHPRASPAPSKEDYLLVRQQDYGSGLAQETGRGGRTAWRDRGVVTVIGGQMPVGRVRGGLRSCLRGRTVWWSKVFVHVCVCLCVCVSVCLCVCVCVCVCVCGVCLCLCLYSHACIHTFVSVCVRMPVCMHVCMHACMHAWCACMYMYTCTYVCICTHTRTHAHARTHTHARAHTHTQTHTQPHTHSLSHTHVHTRLAARCHRGRTADAIFGVWTSRQSHPGAHSRRPRGGRVVVHPRPQQHPHKKKKLKAGDGVCERSQATRRVCAFWREEGRAGKGKGCGGFARERRA